MTNTRSRQRERERADVWLEINVCGREWGKGDLGLRTSFPTQSLSLLHTLRPRCSLVHTEALLSAGS